MDVGRLNFFKKVICSQKENIQLRREIYMDLVCNFTDHTTNILLQNSVAGLANNLPEIHGRWNSIRERQILFMFWI